jgi:hypothetical protein
VTTTLRDAWADLVLGSSCVGCGRPGRLLCPGCEGALPRRARLAWPSPTPAGLVPPFAAGPYEGTYGICESCGEPIGKMRLMAFPRATLCMTCKQREERR